MKEKLFYIQPILPSYRTELASKLAENFDVTVLCGQPDQRSGFGDALPKGAVALNCPHISLLGGRILWQQGVFPAIWKGKPEKVLACANLRDITFWLLLFWCKLNNIPLFAHGQGLYAKKKATWPLKLIYRLLAGLAERYIAYTQTSRSSLLAIGIDTKKLAVADNTISTTANAGSLVKTGAEQGVLFVGRLRKECDLDQLICAMARLRKKHPGATLHIIGGGELLAEYRERFQQSWIVFHGAIYDDLRILEISRDCRVGCYPGNAGLSIVHYFALRLPPLVHSDMQSHMGPEPSYIKDGVNGMLFSREQKSDGIAAALEKIWEMPATEYQTLSSAAFAEYERLNSPSMGEKMVEILRG